MQNFIIPRGYCNFFSFLTVYNFSFLRPEFQGIVNIFIYLLNKRAFIYLTFWFSYANFHYLITFIPFITLMFYLSIFIHASLSFFFFFVFHYISVVTLNFVSAQYSILFLVFPLSKHYRKLSHRHANWFVQFNWSIHRLQRVEHANEIEAMPPKQCHRSKGNDWQTFRFENSTNHLTFFLFSSIAIFFSRYLINF